MKHEPFDPTSKRFRPLAEYSNVLPSCRPGRRLHRATLWRWALKGVGGVRLQTVSLGTARLTTDADIAAFMRALSDKTQSIGIGRLPIDSRIEDAVVLGLDPRMLKAP